MRLGIIADTHDNLAAAQNAVEEFTAANVDGIVHLGDVVAPPMISAFEGLPFHLVYGNNDGDLHALRQAVENLESKSQVHGRFARIERDGCRIAALHGESLREVEAYASTGAFDYVLHGHHHERVDRQIGETRILNPGAHFPTVPAEHRSVAIIDTDGPTHEFRTFSGAVE